MPSPSGSLRVGVIGCGTIAHEHLQHLAGAAHVELVAVCDRSPATARFAAERYGAPFHHTDSREMLAARILDVVHVLTPPHTHVDLIESAFDAGCHVVCEKPMTPTAADARRVLDRAAATGRVLVESHNLLFNDAVLAIERLVAAGALGEVREVDVALALDLTDGPFGDLNLEGPGVVLPGGAVQDFAPHLSYLLLHFAGDAAPVEEVAGRLANLSGNRRVGYDHLEAIVHIGDVRGLLRVSSDVAPPGFRLEIRGTSGSVATDLYNPHLTVARSRDSGKRAPLGQLRSGAGLVRSALTNLRDKALGHDTYHGLPRMIDAVYDAIRDGSTPPISPDDVLATAELTDRLIELAEDGA